MQSAYERLKQSLSNQNGVKLVEVEMKEVQTLADKLNMVISTYETTGEYQRYLAEYKTVLTLEQIAVAIQTPAIKEKFKTFIVPGAPRAIRREKYDKFRNDLRPQLHREYKKLFDSNNLNGLIYPSLVCKPVRFDEVKGAETTWNVIKNAFVTSNAGVPSLTMPMGVTKDGLPIGVQLDGLWNKDKQLLAIANRVYQFIS